MSIALVGNPNVGKSVVFNSLTGSYVTVSNYPGTTVEIARGTGRFGEHKLTVIDTPGVNSLTPYSEDEKVTRDILSGGDVACVIQVADSKNMKRSVALTLQLLKLGIPLVLDLNMSDEAKERGVHVDAKKLAGRLGIEVVETIAITGEGIVKLKEAVARTCFSGRRPKNADRKTDPQAAGMAALNRQADGLLDGVVTIAKPLKTKFSETVSRLTTRPLTGIPILLFVLFVMYEFVGKFAAGTGVDFFENTVFGKFINPFFTKAIDSMIGPGIARDFLVGDYGILTMAITYAFAIIFPIVTAFFLFFGVLEDSGYLPRLSILSDRIFKVMGLNGRAILPVILGLGCGTMATLTTRILDTKKERVIVTLLLALAIPCSAQLGVIMGMLGALSVRAFAIWLGIILLVMLVIGWAASRVVPGSRSPFIQEIPPVRRPQIGNISAKTLARLKWYLKEAVPLFLLATAILFFMDRTGFLKVVEDLFRPLVVGLLGLPVKATEAFIIGFLRRDYGAAGLYALSRSGTLDNIQILVSLVVITLFVPCVAQFFVMIKERGIRIAFAIGSFVFIFAFLVGGAVNFALRYFAAKGAAVI